MKKIVICIYSDSCTHIEKCSHRQFHKCNSSCSIFCEKTQRASHCIDPKIMERKTKLKEGTKFYCYQTRYDYDNNPVNIAGKEYTLIKNDDNEIVYMTNDIDTTNDHFFYSILVKNGWYNFQDYFYNIKDVRKKKLINLKLYENRR